MTPAALVADLRTRGVVLEPRGDRLAVRPVDRVTPIELEALKRHKAEVLRLLRREEPDPTGVAWVLGLPLNQLDRMLEVRVPWLDRPLWFVPDETAASLLLAEGISRGRIWTARELRDLFTIPGLTKAGARTVAEAKLAMDGTVETVRSRKAASR